MSAIFNFHYKALSKYLSRVESVGMKMSEIKLDRSPLLGACNSHNKPMQRHSYSDVCLDIFPGKEASSSLHEHALVKINQCGLTRTCRHHVDMTTLVRECDCNWSLRFLWGSEFEINAN